MNIEQKLTSMEVAEMVEKDHNMLLRDIRRYVQQLGQSKIAQSDFFQSSSYQNSQNKTMPCYMISKKGCEFIGNKLTGTKGAVFTARYINRFHEMQEVLEAPKSPIELLKAATLEVNQKVDALDEDLQTFKQDLPILGIEESRITAAVRKKGVHCLCGKKSEAYRDKSLRGKVYSDIYGQLKRQFGVATYKAIKRNQCESAVYVVESYELPLVLENQVEDCNAQIAM